jgi:hypothetical protein
MTAKTKTKKFGYSASNPSLFLVKLKRLQKSVADK